MSSREASIAARKQQIEQRIDDYTTQRHITLSLEAHLRANDFGILEIELPLERVEEPGTPVGYPDLVFGSQSGRVILDIKCIRSDSSQTFQDRVAELSKYKGKVRGMGVTFEGELVALCPKQKVIDFDPPEGYCAIGYDIEDATVSLGPVKNRLVNRELRDLFRSGRLDFPLQYGTAAFLRDEPPLAYTAERVYSALFSATETILKQPDVRRTDITTLRHHMRSLYPAYLKDKSGNPQQQIADGRLDRGLDFLSRHGWVKRDGRMLSLNTSKGSRSGNLIGTFVDLQAEDEYNVYGEKLGLVTEATLDIYRALPTD